MHIRDAERVFWHQGSIINNKGNSTREVKKNHGVGKKAQREEQMQETRSNRHQIQGGEEAHKSQSRGQEGEAKRTVFLEFDP